MMAHIVLMLLGGNIGDDDIFCCQINSCSEPSEPPNNCTACCNLFLCPAHLLEHGDKSFCSIAGPSVSFRLKHLISKALI